MEAEPQLNAAFMPQFIRGLERPGFNRSNKELARMTFQPIVIMI